MLRHVCTGRRTAAHAGRAAGARGGGALQPGRLAGPAAQAGLQLGGRILGLACGLRLPATTGDFAGHHSGATKAVVVTGIVQSMSSRTIVERDGLTYVCGM